jgi:hypothetical protein
MIRTTSFAFCGTIAIRKLGLVFAPSQVNRGGMTPPVEMSLLVTNMDVCGAAATGKDHRSASIVRGASSFITGEFLSN